MASAGGQQAYRGLQLYSSAVMTALGSSALLANHCAARARPAGCPAVMHHDDHHHRSAARGGLPGRRAGGARRLSRDGWPAG